VTEGSGDALLKKLFLWGRIEKQLWADCMESDPLLPRELWPPSYLGEKAWNERGKTLRRLGKLTGKLLANG
jgi:DNA-binding transcriptional regulator PaaX